MVSVQNTLLKSPLFTRQLEASEELLVKIVEGHRNGKPYSQINPRRWVGERPLWEAHTLPYMYVTSNEASLVILESLGLTRYEDHYKDYAHVRVVRPTRKGLGLYQRTMREKLSSPL